MPLSPYTTTSTTLERSYSIRLTLYNPQSRNPSPLDGVHSTRLPLPLPLDYDLYLQQLEEQEEQDLYLPPPRSSEEDFWSLQLPKSSIVGRDWDPNLVGTLSPASPLPTRNNKKKETNSGTRIWSQHFNKKNDSERSPPLLQVASDKLWTPSKALPNTTVTTTHERRRVLDYRFGPIEIDWIKMNNNPNPSSPSPSPSPSVESGTSSLYWGTIHLYREGGIPLEYESSSREKQLAKDLDDGKTLGMISVPGNLNASAVLKFIASNYNNNNQQEQQQGSGSGSGSSGSLEDLKQVRMLRDSTPSRSLVVLQFYDREKAKTFRDKFNGKKYYDSKDSELCHVVPISSILIKTSLEPPPTTTTKVTVKEEDANPRAGEQIEIPTCPICLERLDSKVTGLIQVSCKHNFHCNCLLRWGDSRCPVCRATNLPSSSSKEGGQGRVLTNCNVCNSPSNLWICIICGNVGCGRYQGGHAHSHFSETGHSYSLELQTGRIWSYIDDEYVHRLLRLPLNTPSSTNNSNALTTLNNNNNNNNNNNTAARLIELPSLNHNNLNNPDDISSKIASSYHHGGLGGGGPDHSAEESQMKLERIAIEYSNLLNENLTQQREWFEDEVERNKVFIKNWERKVFDLETSLEREKKSKDSDRKEFEKTLKGKDLGLILLKERLEGIEKELNRNQEERKKEKLESNRLKKSLEKELEQEKSVTMNLTLNLSSMRREVELGRKETDQVRSEVEELKDQLNDLMAALTMRDKIEQEPEGSELRGASIGVAATLGANTSEGGKSPSQVLSEKRKKKNKKK